MDGRVHALNGCSSRNPTSVIRSSVCTQVESGVLQNPRRIRAVEEASRKSCFGEQCRMWVVFFSGMLKQFVSHAAWGRCFLVQIYMGVCGTIPVILSGHVALFSVPVFQPCLSSNHPRTNAGLLGRADPSFCQCRGPGPGRFCSMNWSWIVVLPWGALGSLGLGKGKSLAPGFQHRPLGSQGVPRDWLY